MGVIELISLSDFHALSSMFVRSEEKDASFSLFLSLHLLNMLMHTDCLVYTTLYVSGGLELKQCQLLCEFREADN